jgi:hypothetical protein
MIFRIRAPRCEFTGLSSLRSQLPHIVDISLVHRRHSPPVRAPQTVSSSGHASRDAAQADPRFRKSAPALHKRPIAYLRIAAKALRFQRHTIKNLN